MEWYKNEQNNRRFLLGCFVIVVFGTVMAAILITLISLIRNGCTLSSSSSFFCLPFFLAYETSIKVPSGKEPKDCRN